NYFTDNQVFELLLNTPLKWFKVSLIACPQKYLYKKVENLKFVSRQVQALLENRVAVTVKTSLSSQKFLTKSSAFYIFGRFSGIIGKDSQYKMYREYLQIMGYKANQPCRL